MRSMVTFDHITALSDQVFRQDIQIAIFGSFVSKAVVVPYLSEVAHPHIITKLADSDLTSEELCL